LEITERRHGMTHHLKKRGRKPPTEEASAEPTGSIEPARAFALTDLVDYAEGSIVSRTLVDKEQGTLTLFAFDKGQGLSEHTAPFDAYVVGLDGEAALKIGGKTVKARAGQVVLMPAGVPHDLRATSRFKMFLALVRA
jgi:quercetin dioxygenase-like cupin family protein